MPERRQDPRALTLKTATIRSVDIPSDIDCAILDISERGACILVPVGADIPASFELAIDPERTSHACTLAWRAGSRIGVTFENPITLRCE
jgi:hypothetical protein